MNQIDQQLQRLRAFSRTSRGIFWIILAAFVAIALFAFFTSRFGQNVLLCCCGGVILVTVVGILSERGMRRR